MITAQILGGVALIVFGVRFLRKGLDRLFGMRLSAWLVRTTDNRWKALAGGACAGAIAPSSTGISLLSMQLLQAGRLDAGRMLAILLGANIGITITVQLLAFRIQDYAGLFLIVGVIAFQFLRREPVRGVGQCLLALGFVFFAMQLIGTGARAFASNPETVQVMGLLEGHPWVVLIATAVLAMLMQSSTATIGLALALGGTGLLPASVLVQWVMGTNLGIAGTSLIAGWSTLEGRRLGTANIIAKAAVCVPIILIPGLADGLFDWMPGQLERQTAMFHTGFNLLVGIIAVALAGPLVKLVRAMIPSDTSTGGLPHVETYLDERALESPSLALAHATRETLLMGDEARTMLEQFWKAYQKDDRELARRVQKADDRIDQLNLNLREYLSRISEDKHAAETHWQLTLHTFSNELESVGDIIDKHLCDIILKREPGELSMPDAEHGILEELHTRVADRLMRALGLLTTREPADAKELLAGKEALNEWCRKAQREHYSRLEAGDRSLVGASPQFLDMLNSYRRINSHLTALAYAFQKSRGRPHKNSGETDNAREEAGS